MPRPSLVPKEDAIAVVEKHMEHFKTDDFPPYSSHVWKDMAKDLGGRWTHHNVYTNIRENRRDILTIARANQGIVVPEKIEIQNQQINDPIEEYLDEEDCISIDDTFNDSKLLNINDDMSDFEVDAEASGLSHFDVLITREEWREMKGYSSLHSARYCAILNPGIWTNILALAVTKQTRLPCAFVFDNSKIYESPASLHYLRIKGHCRSKVCQNVLFGYVDRDPGDNDFYMTIRTRDTMGMDHEDVQRPLRGMSYVEGRRKKKMKFEEEVIEEGCSAMRQQTAKYVNIFLCRRCNYPNIITRKK